MFIGIISAVVTPLIIVGAFLVNTIIAGKDATIEAKQATIDALRQGDESKDELIAYLKERYGVLPMTNRYSSYRNVKLQESALQIASDVRELLREHHFQIRSRNNESDALWEAIGQATNEVERSALWREHRRQSAKESEARMRPLLRQWDEEYRVNAIMLRDEMLARFLTEERPVISMLCFENPQSTISFEMVADGLETLARNLPTED